MKLIVAGGRDYKPRVKDILRLNWLHMKRPVTELISGGAEGADKMGMDWATSLGIPMHLALPDWEQYGKAAGPMRNREMARLADACVLFPGGAGTASMAAEAEYAGIKVWDWRES